MAFTLTFLGKGGTGRTTIAVAAAKHLAAGGRRVLLVGEGLPATFSRVLDLEAPLGSDPRSINSNLYAVCPQCVDLLERNWGELKRLEAEYLRDPFFKQVFGEELGLLPGLDRALILNALRQYDDSGDYDAIVYDGTGDRGTLLMFGLPGILSWYVRRFSRVIGDSDFAKAIAPFIQPITAAVSNVSWSGLESNRNGPLAQMTDLLDRGNQALSDPARVAAWLVSTPDSEALMAAKYLWGCAQQANLTVAGLLLNQSNGDDTNLGESFKPLPVRALPTKTDSDWSALVGALPDLTDATNAPKPIEIDAANRQVRLFLPGFDKKSVKLTQYGPEVTVEAGDQRRNIDLPPSLSGRSVSGAKFQDGYLMISF